MKQARARKTAAAQVATQVPARAPKVPAVLAVSAPEAKRVELTKLYTQLLTGYQEIEKKLSVPRRDVAGAVAAFLAASYMAYRNVDMPDAHFPVLVKQMRELLQASPGFASATVAARQDMYEQLAILGTLMAVTRMGPRDAKTTENVRVAAKGYLEQLVGIADSERRSHRVALIVGPDERDADPVVVAVA